MSWQHTMEYLRSLQLGETGITAAVVVAILAIGLITHVLAWGLRRLLDRRLINLDHEARFSIERMGQVIIWVIGVLAALGWISQELNIESLAQYELYRLGDRPITPQSILLFGLVVLLTWYASRLAGRLNHFALFQRLDPGPRYTVVRLLQYAVWVIGVFIGLHMVNIDLTALAVVLGALGVGIGFGLQSVVGNFVAGLVLLFEQPIRVTDFVSTENIEGRVKEIRFRSTVIQTNDNISMIVPNSELTTRSVINWSHLDPKIRVHAPVGVAYGSDIQLVTKALLEVAAETEGVLKDPEPVVWFKEFGDSSLNFELLVWTDDPVRYRRLHSRLNYAIDAAFRGYNIQIPFPQRDLHVRSADGLRALVKPKTPPA